VTLELCNITAKLPSESFCLWPPENRSVAPREDRGPRLRNPAIDQVGRKFWSGFSVTCNIFLY